MTSFALLGGKCSMKVSQISHSSAGKHHKNTSPLRPQYTQSKRRTLIVRRQEASETLKAARQQQPTEFLGKLGEEGS